VLSAGAVIGEAWQMYKAQWRHLIPIAFVVYLLISLLTFLLAVFFGSLGIFIGALISLVGVFWLQGALVLAVDDVRDGRADLSLEETLSRVLPKLNTLTIAGLLAGIGISIGLVLLIVPGLYLLTIWLLIVPVIMLEGAGIIDSFGRSRELVSGQGWNVFGVVVLTIAIYLAVWIVIGIVEAATANWIDFLLNVATQTAVAPLFALSWTLTYFALRDLKVPAPAVAA
jgi:hypothetical protein